MGRISERVTVDTPQPNAAERRLMRRHDMPDLFAVIDDAWQELARSPRAFDVRERWVLQQPHLSTARDLRAMVTSAQGREDLDYRRRNQMQRALLAIAAADDDARLAMLVVLQPGLRNVARNNRHVWGRDETSAMVVEQAVRRIVSFPAASRAQPAANIVLRVRNDLWRMRQRELAISDATEVLETDEDAASDEVEPSAGDLLLHTVAAGMSSGYVSARGARLILLHRMCDVPTEHVARAEGADPVAIRKYRNRAEAALLHARDAVA
jgi:hypothetical protein